MKRLIPVIVILMFCSSLCFAGRVHLKSGQSVEGQVLQEGEFYIVTRGGLRTEIATSKVDYVEETETVWDTFNSLYETVDWSEKNDILKLIDFASENSLKSELKSLYRNVLALNPNHPEANRALERVYMNGNWVKRDDFLSAQGMVEVETRKWITREEAAIEKAKILHEKQLVERKKLITRLFEQLDSKDRQIVTQARKELKNMEQDLPGLIKILDNARDFFSTNSAKDISFDGRYATMVLRIAKVDLDTNTPGGTGMVLLPLRLGSSGGIVSLQLPQLSFLEVRSTVMIPVY